MQKLTRTSTQATTYGYIYACCFMFSSNLTFCEVCILLDTFRHWAQVHKERRQRFWQIKWLQTIFRAEMSCLYTYEWCIPFLRSLLLLLQVLMWLWVFSLMKSSDVSCVQNKDAPANFRNLHTFLRSTWTTTGSCMRLFFCHIFDPTFPGHTTTFLCVVGH